MSSFPVINGTEVAIEPPPGYICDFDHPKQKNAVAAYCIVAVFGFLSTLFCGQRLYVNAVVRKRLWWDDLLVILGFVSSWIIQIFILEGFIHKYIGTHLWEISTDKFYTFSKWATYVNPILYVFPTVFCKVALQMFYLQLGNMSLRYKAAIFMLIFATVGSGIGILFSSIFICSPVRKGWDFRITSGSCIDRPAMYQATAGIGMATDVLIFAIPIPMVMRLQMSRRHRIGLVFLFFVGSITVITSIVRLVLLVTSLYEDDLPWSAGLITIWV
ncbi:hypothetical protein CFIMG_005955RAa [Ceratocystis fimbriata CBS 114723]|uniref:Rhodopsin domain-containing protein n=1 Tax=Ceratocystis fimbriata CBS 114723 TaxID=1035309 RepID=A0A2C5WXS7_9PEZI|nr:hypothetical protein CFIMG_005955RAa [Ceratocystis fimbriata CBS 114723]